jgi:predicted HTH domain antitoxin
MEARLLEELVDAMMAERGVDPKVIHEEALRLYLNMNPGLKLDGAVALWRKGRISLAKAAEVAGLTVPELKEVLAARGIIRETEGKSREEMDAKLKETLPWQQP